MKLKIVINGFNQTGRDILRAVYANNNSKHYEIVAINDLVSSLDAVHSLSYDDHLPRLDATVGFLNNCISINGTLIEFFSETHLKKLPWSNLNADLLIDCTEDDQVITQLLDDINKEPKFDYISTNKLELNVELISGVDSKVSSETHQRLSTGNGLSHSVSLIANLLLRHYTLESCKVIELYSDHQSNSDSIEPFEKTWTAKISLPQQLSGKNAIEQLVPELLNRVDGYSIRSQDSQNSVAIVEFDIKEQTNVEVINNMLQNAVQGEFKQYLGDDISKVRPSDKLKNPLSCIVSFEQTKVNNKTLILVLVFDRNWGIVNRTLESALQMLSHRLSN